MEKIDGIIIDGKVFVAEKDANCSCLKCDMIEEDGRCAYKQFCARFGVDNIFRYSPSLTERLNNPKTKEDSFPSVTWQSEPKRVRIKIEEIEE